MFTKIKQKQIRLDKLFTIKQIKNISFGFFYYNSVRIRFTQARFITIPDDTLIIKVFSEGPNHKKKIM